jgi:hypothetical protein
VVIPSARNSSAVPAKPRSDTTMMSSSKSIVLTPPSKQAAAQGQTRVQSQAAQRARPSQARESRP